MNYGELKTAVLTYAARSDLSAQVAGFVRLAEGMIRRELRAYPLSITLTETDRSSGGVYTLPSTISELRAVYGTDSQGNSFALEQVGPLELRDTLDASAPAVQYAMLGSQIEFRGTPATGSTFELRVLGHPAALSSDSDTNDLLTDHEAIYLYGALYHLYTLPQDLELASKAYDTYSDALEKLGEQIGRRLGGLKVAGYYNMDPSGTY